MVNSLFDASLVMALFILLPYFCYRSKRWPTWKQYLTYEKECIFHRWIYSPPHFIDGSFPPRSDESTFRKCPECKRRQYKVYTDSGVLSCWLDLS